MLLVAPEQLLPPSICLICETQPDGEFVVDTLRNLTTGVASVFNGRKYVCERCVGEFAKLFGYEHGNAVQRAIIDLEFAHNELANIRQRVVELAEHIRDFVQEPGASVVDNTPQPAQTPAETAVKDASKPSFEDVFGGVPQPTGKQATGGVKSETPKSQGRKARAPRANTGVSPVEAPDSPASPDGRSDGN